jgi:predicted RNase H-like nuclease
LLLLPLLPGKRLLEYLLGVPVIIVPCAVSTMGNDFHNAFRLAGQTSDTQFMKQTWVIIRFLSSVIPRIYKPNLLQLVLRIYKFIYY